MLSSCMQRVEAEHYKKNIKKHTLVADKQGGGVIQKGRMVRLQRRAMKWGWNRSAMQWDENRRAKQCGWD